jgi:hypothetical protein
MLENDPSEEKASEFANKLQAYLVATWPAPQQWSTSFVSPAVSDALGIGGPALMLKSSGKLDLATMAQA